MSKRIGVIGIVVSNRARVAPEVNNLLSEFGEIIVARMGLPYRERDVNVIGLIVEATTDELGAMTGRLGMIQNVKVKSLVV